MGLVENIDYISDNPRLVGGITFTAIRYDISETVKIIGNNDKAKNYLRRMLSAAVAEYEELFGNDECIKEIQCLLMFQEVNDKAETKEVAS